MRVTSIKWLSIPAAEAEVEISDGVHTCTAFSCPCDAYIGQELTDPLHAFDIRNARIADNVGLGIWNVTDTGLGRRVVAELIDPTSHMFEVGGITLVVDDHLPGGLVQGNIIEFECARIDLW